MIKSSKRINKILILFTSLMFLIAGISVVFAAYTFSKKITNDVEVGQINVDNKKFINYQSSSNTKLRVDTLIDVEDLTLDTTTTYAQTTDTVFQSSKVYYVLGTYTKAIVSAGATVTANTYYEDKNGGYSLTSDTTFDSSKSYYTKTSSSGYTATTTITIGATISGTYYVATATHSGITNVGTVINPAGDEITAEISSSDSKVITFYNGTTEIITITITSFNSNGVEKATTSNEGCYVVVDSDGLGFTVIDSSLSIGEYIESETITCSATEKKQDSSNIYLNQLGFEFEFTNEIAVYVRIHIKDAWVLTRQYASAVKETYSIKDQISGSSPFAIADDDWYYDVEENTVYLKEMILPSLDDNGAYQSQSYSFIVNQAYFYTNSKTSVYTEYVDVQVSFTVDIVQANRALDEWKIDPSTLSSN